MNTETPVETKRIVLIMGGGIAAYKCLDLLRRLRERGISVRVVMTRAAQQFVTPLSVSALSNERVFTDLFDLDDEREIGHIRLSRSCDLIVVAPATADLLAKAANGHADDLATAVLLASNKPVLMAPAMNPHMWLHPATRRNVETLTGDGISFIGPAVGEMAEAGEAGPGRLADVPDLVTAIEARLDASLPTALAGRHVLITSGPTHEPIDPVRYIANRSSGKQGHAIAAAAVAAGARVTLISGPVNLPPPRGATTISVNTGEEMFHAVQAALPAEVAVFCAAVADWKVAQPAAEKIKKSGGSYRPQFELVENEDILKTVAHMQAGRPRLVIGFAAETENIIAFATKKRRSKGADWTLANDVSAQGGAMGGERNRVHLITEDGAESWPEMAKRDVARTLIDRVAAFLESEDHRQAPAESDTTR